MIYYNNRAAIDTWKDSQYLEEIKVAKASEMGYGLFAYKNGKEALYPTIEEYVNALENNALTKDGSFNYRQKGDASQLN